MEPPPCETQVSTDRLIGRLCDSWAQIHDSHSSADIYQRKAELEQFLEAYYRLNDEDRLQVDRLNRYENISSALSRQLLLLIFEICDSTVKRYGRTDSTATEHSTNCSTVTPASPDVHFAESPKDTDEQQCVKKIERFADKDAFSLHADSSERRCQWLRDFFLHDIGGLFLQTLSKIGAKDIANGREISAVLVRILPTTRWNFIEPATHLEAQKGYGRFVREVFKIRTYNGDWRESIKRGTLGMTTSSALGRSLESTNGASSTLLRQLSGSKSVAAMTDYIKATELWHNNSDRDQRAQRYDRELSQDQLTLTVLNLLESLIVHENVLTIDENSVTLTCLRVALVQLKRQELLEESAENRLIIRHKLLGLVMLCLNNVFLLEKLDTNDINLRIVATELMELLKGELNERPSNVLSCEFMYNLVYTLVVAVNQSFLHFCDNLVTEQLFMSVFKLLENNLDTIKNTYGLLHLGAQLLKPSAVGGTSWGHVAQNSSSAGLVETLIKMLQNFILALAPLRFSSYKKSRKCRPRLHHSRQGARAGYICAMENFLLNLFPLMKHFDQRLVVSFFKAHQLCCCNTNAHTLEVLMKLSNDDLIPKLRLNFASRAVVYAIFNRSQCETCESDRAANTFHEQFTRTHREVFREFRRAENRSRLPTFLRYLLDIVRVVPFRLRSFLLQELIIELLNGELQQFAEREGCLSDDDSPIEECAKEIVNGCLLIVCRAVAEDERIMKLFYRHEMIELLRVFSGRIEFVHNMHHIMTIGIARVAYIHSEKLGSKLEEIVFEHLDNLAGYIGNLFEAIANSKLGVSLKPFGMMSTTAGRSGQRDEPLETTLQLHLEHWKTVRHLLKENDRFRKQFVRRYGGLTGVRRFLDFSYNLASVCLFRGVAPQHTPETTSLKIPDPSEQVSSEPVRRSVLNIFHFNDQLIDGTLSSASLYYSATDEAMALSTGSSVVVKPPDASQSEEENDYSFLRELRLAAITGEWEMECTAAITGGQPSTAISKRGVVSSKLGKKWSLSELFNIRQILSDLMEEYLPSSKEDLAKLPECIRNLFSDHRGNAVVRKKLAKLLEMIMASMQLLMNENVLADADGGTLEANTELENTMQIALFELKKLLMSNALSNWDCPSTANNVMNVLQALLKVAEVRKEVNSAPPGSAKHVRDNEEHDLASRSCEEDDQLSDTLSYHDEHDQVQDLSSTDESYTTAREDGYEGDVEIETLSPQEQLAKKEAKERGGKLCDESRSAVSEQICTIVTEILVELSARCVEMPDHWSQPLAQMIVKLNMIRSYLGGSLYLIRGFASVLRTNDSRLKELQSSIMDLIVDLENPNVLVKYVQLLGQKDPPVQLILRKLTNLFEMNAGLECYQSVQYPALHADGTFSYTSDVLLAKKITYLREHHLFFNVDSGFTDAATIVPLNYANFYPWHGNGFSVSLWMRVDQSTEHPQAEYTHVLSVGSEKQLLAVYLNSQRQLVLRYSKPDHVITAGNTRKYLDIAIARSQCCEHCAKEMQQLWTYKHLLRSITDGAPQPFVLDTAGAQCVYCFTQLPVGGPKRKASQSSRSEDRNLDTDNYQPSAFDAGNLKQCTIGQQWCLPDGIWLMLTFAVQQTMDGTITITITLDGVQRLASLSLPNASRMHIDTDLTVLAVGHRAATPGKCSVGYGLAGVHLFSKCITDEAALANLYAVGPNVNNFAAFANGYMIPNYGTLNLSKLAVDDLRTIASLQLLEKTHLGYLVACKADTFVGRNAQNIGVMSFAGKLRVTEHNSLQRSLFIAGGVSVMLVCFARVVEVSESPVLHAAALKTLLRIAHCNHDFFNEFVHCNYLELIGIVLKSNKCDKDIALLATLLEVAFDQPIVAKRGDQYRVLTCSVARVRYPGMITFLLENFHIWIDQSEEVLDLLLTALATVTRDKHPGMMYNCQTLQGASLVPALIDFCRVNFVIPAKTVKISRKAADLLVSLIAILSPTPPRVSLLNEIMELLLLMHKPTDSYVTHDRQKFYFNVSTQYGLSVGKRSDKTTSSVASSSGGSGAATTPKKQLRDRRLRPTSHLRKILPLTISVPNSSSLESATTSFIIDSSASTNANTSTATIATSDNLSKSPKLTSPDGGANSEECYEKLNNALAEGKWRRKSLLDSIENGSHGKRKLRRLKSSPNMRSSPGGRRKLGGSPRMVTSSPKTSCCPRKDLNRIAVHQQQQQSAPASSSSTMRYKFFEQNYFATGNDFLQESFLRVMCDFLLILPDSDARKFLSGENRILETLLILANNGNIRIRTMLLNLVAVIDDRIDSGKGGSGGGGGGGSDGATSSSGVNVILQQYSEEQSKVFWYHLANQIGTHSVNGELVASCYRWVTKSNVNLLMFLGNRGEDSPLAALLHQQNEIVVIRQNGLNVLIAILIQAHIEPPLFRCVLQLIEYICMKHRRRGGQYMIDNGLVWSLVKTAVKMNEKEEHVREASRAYLLDFLTSFSHLMVLSAVANPFWDLLNGLTVAQKHKSDRVTKAVRNLHATLMRNVLQIFIFRPKLSIIGNKNSSFTVELVGCNLSKAEIKTRFNRLHDKAVQFVTNSDPDGELSDAEMALVRHLMSRTLNGNPRGGNIILWCLLPKRPIRLKLYTIKQLNQYLEGGGSHLLAICDVKMLKVFVQSILLLNQKHIPLEDLRLVNAFYQSIDGGLAHGASWNLTQTLKDFEYLRAISINDQEQTILKSTARQEKLIYSCTVAAMQVTRNSVEKQNRLRKELIIQLRKDNDYRFYDQWHQLVERLTHEDAPWYNGAAYPNSWELDDTYGPDMALKRTRRCHQTIDRRFLLKEPHSERESVLEKGCERKALLSYLYPGDYRAEYSVEDQVLYTFAVRKITPSRELVCECIITSTELVLKPYGAGELEIYELHDITKIWTKRYEHQESAVEVFLKSGKSLFIVFDRDPGERETFEGFFHDLVVRSGRGELDHQTQLWREGALSNWEYLMLLNQISGRTFHDLMQYPVFPWVLASYDSPTLDLLSERTFRLLEKPIAVQHRELEKHYINNYNHLRQADESGDPNGASRKKLQPYHYSSHYSNSGTVLHFLVRVLPFTSMFLQYQDDSFDIPDRTFHSLQTTWNLASKDSPTDVKELIPEFFSFPEFLENQEGFDFGTRQSGEPVNHVELPPWCNGSARLFVLIHRQALEANVVRRQLAYWIDLIFGYKQTGQAAIDSINVFHPATYCDFSSADIDDPVMKLALETMVKTYGQMPRRLFDLPHPPPVTSPLGANPPNVLESVIGLRWGLYCGSPVLPSPKLADVWERPSKELVERFAGRTGGLLLPSSLVSLEGDKVFAMPERMNVFCAPLQGGPKKYYTISWGEVDDRLRIRALQENGSPVAPETAKELWYGTNGYSYDPITACGTDPNCTSIFFGHRSGRIAVFQRRSRRRRASFFNQNMQPSVTMMARSRSTSFRRWIDRKSANLRRKLELDSDDQQQQEHPNHKLPDGDQMEWNYPILLLKHRAPIRAIRISMEYKIVVSASIDGCAAIWDVNSLTYVREIPQPVNMLHSMISQVAISPTLGDIVLVHSNTNGAPVRTAAQIDSWSSGTLVEEDDSFEVTENYNLDYVNITMAATTNRRDQLRLYTINAQYVEHVFLESPIRAAAYSTVKEGCGVNCIVVALESGIVRFYSSWNLALLREVNVEPTGIRCVLFSKNQHLLLLTGHGTVQTWSAENLSGPLPTIQEPYQYGG